MTSLILVPMLLMLAAGEPDRPSNAFGLSEEEAVGFVEQIPHVEPVIHNDPPYWACDDPAHTGAVLFYLFFGISFPPNCTGALWQANLACGEGGQDCGWDWTLACRDAAYAAHNANEFCSPMIDGDRALLAMMTGLPEVDERIRDALTLIWWPYFNGGWYPGDQRRIIPTTDGYVVVD